MAFKDKSVKTQRRLIKLAMSLGTIPAAYACAFYMGYLLLVYGVAEIVLYKSIPAIVIFIVANVFHVKLNKAYSRRANGCPAFAPPKVNIVHVIN